MLFHCATFSMYILIRLFESNILRIIIYFKFTQNHILDQPYFPKCCLNWLTRVVKTNKFTLKNVADLLRSSQQTLQHKITLQLLLKLLCFYIIIICCLVSKKCVLTFFRDHYSLLTSCLLACILLACWLFISILSSVGVMHYK